MEVLTKEPQKRPSSYGGYEYSFVEEPPDDTVCQICRLVAKDPSQMECCGKIYCTSCLNELVEFSFPFPSCPNCRRAGKRYKDHRSQRQIKSLKIMCPKSADGCEWKGKLSDLDEHSRKECCYTNVTCPHGDCSKVLKASELQGHLDSECPYRTYVCPDCQESGTYQSIVTTHREECPAVETACPNGCECTNITRGSLQRHRDVCPQEVVSCRFSDVGCDVRLKREEISAHNKDSLECHLGIAMETVSSLKKQLVTVEQKLSRLEKETQYTTKRPVALFKIDRFQDRMDEDEEWSSPYFLTHPNGYKLCLNVIPNGVGEGEGTHVSTSLWLSIDQNPHLTWPLSAKIKIELLNQCKDDNHRCALEEICEEPEPNIDGFNAEFVTEMLISHNDLFLHEDTGTQYLKDDCIYIRISVELPERSFKPWLCNPADLLTRKPTASLLLDF